jgi:hypothetical protein
MAISAAMTVPTLAAAAVASNPTLQTHGQTRTSLNPFCDGSGGGTVQMGSAS